MKSELAKKEILYEIRVVPINIWVLTGLSTLLMLMAFFSLFQPDRGPTWTIVLIFTIILACMTVILFFGMRSEKLVLTKDLFYYRSFFLTKLVPLSSVVSAKLSLKPLVLEIVEETTHKKISLNLALYDPAKCEKMSSLLIDLLAERTSATDGL